MAKKKVFTIGNALSMGLEETITAAHNYAGELRIEVIPLKKIKVDPENPRIFTLTFEDLFSGLSPSDPHYIFKQKEKESLESMAASIKEQGIINPVVVYKQGEDYRLIAGERRTLASILAGKTDVQAKILESRPSELKISILQWIENIERSDLSLWERVRNLEKIIKAYAAKAHITPEKVSITELGHLLGCSKPHAMNYKAVIMADDEIKSLIQDNKIKSLEKAALLANIPSGDIRQQAVKACLEGADLKKLKMLVQLASAQQKRISEKVIPKKRGRQAGTINIGATKNMQVAKMIFDSILQNSSLSHLSSYFNEINWKDYGSINLIFKNLIKKLEELKN